MVIIAFGTLCMIFYRDDLVKLHFAGVSDTIGTAILLIGYAMKYPEHLIKWIFLIFLILITGPIATMAISKGFYEKTQKK